VSPPVEILDVAVVGCGPVGATFANLLAQRGLRVAAFEQETDVYHLPRAAHFDGEIMRVFQGLGIADAVLSTTAPIDGMHFFNASGEKLFGYDATDEIGPMGWAADYMFTQPELEHVLRQRLDGERTASLHLGHEVTEITETPELVTLGVRDLATGAERTVSARYVVGCDGARSLTRKTIASPLTDYEFDQPWLVVDSLPRRPLGLPRVAVQYCDPARPATFIPFGRSRARWEIMLLDGETAADIEHPDRIRELLAPWVDVDDLDVIRAVVYVFHGLVAEQWRHDRVFVMGDAAHQMPPFLGQGMCAGIRDAANLAWKLDFVLRGRAPDALLDTYQSERAPHVRTIIELAVTIGRIIQTTDQQVAAERDAHFRAGGGEGMDSVIMPPIGPGLVADGGGEPIPQPDRLDDALGSGFTVVAPDVTRLEVGDDTRIVWDKLGITTHVAPGLANWCEQQGAYAAIVRPDHYVYGLARAPGDLDTLTAVLAAHGL
jgi:3-(3-hydroxy-phenyl)propionate hydroxylase